ncbi:hypothetical protein DL96DRAFT_1508970 [Flagelloscypha sp. PMI_526]|nr:hypothetical protein DL96DRAFT_1508970 [Flagelloscypha sp. PMI_526]
MATTVTTMDKQGQQQRGTGSRQNNVQPNGQWQTQNTPWTPSVNAMPFYPSWSSSPQPSPQLQQAPPQQMGYDPVAMQAQWQAYQHMMYQAQQQAQQQAQHHQFQQPFLPPNPAFNPFTSGTPPPPPQQQQGGYHPYRRPQTRQPSESSQRRPSQSQSQPQQSSSPPQRQRTDSMQSASSQERNSPKSRPSPPPPAPPHHRSASSSSSSSASASLSGPASPASAASVAATRRPSPLASAPLNAPQTLSNREKRMSRDDSDLAAMMSSSSTTHQHNVKGLGRFRQRTLANVEDVTDDDDESIKVSRLNKGKERAAIPAGRDVDQSSQQGSQSPALSSSQPQIQKVKKKSKGGSIFSNARLNRSTDNISLSSTMSSASVVIRKLGSVGGKLVSGIGRRNSLAGITGMFKKDKDKDKEKDDDKKKSKKSKSAKGTASEASVSYATAEFDAPVSGSETPGMEGLSPAAKLARQHTLRSKAREEEEEKRRKEAESNGTGVNGWDRNTATRVGSNGNVRVNEDGTRVFVEDEDEEDEDEDWGGQRQGAWNEESWEDGGAYSDDDDDENDDTIRMGGPGHQPNQPSWDSANGDEVEPWGGNVRRSVERARQPVKGILKRPPQPDAATTAAADSSPLGLRHRSNSYTPETSNGFGSSGGPGPLARIPSPDPDHIDGLHRHGSHSSGHGREVSAAPPMLPPLSFGDDSDLASSPLGSASATPTNDKFPQHTQVHPNPNPLQPPPPTAGGGIFSHPNSSAPTLSLTSTTPSPNLAQRSASGPVAPKRLAFASNLSVYDTFASSVYDRRSEPATWSRLTPALAQRIKEELNSYKMEEMEVHAASRAHTQFFV